MILTALVFAGALLQQQQIPQGIRYKKAPDAVNDRALKKLRVLLANPTPEAEVSGMSSDIVICGPTLWGAVKDDAPKALQSALNLECYVPTGSKLIHVVGKRFRSPAEKAAFWHYLLALVQAAPKLAELRKANAEELNYCWRWIPYDIEEPLFVAVFSKDLKLLFQFDDNAADPKVFTVDAVR